MTRVAVNPDLLDWALARADLSADALIKAFPKIHDWLTGEIQPTLKQLESFANKTHTAIGYLFLPEPPVETLPVPDFRTMANARLDHPTPDLLDTLYLCQQRQDWYRDYLRLHGEAAPTFVGSATIEDDVISVAARMRAVLSFDVEQRRSMPTWKEALRQFITSFPRSAWECIRSRSASTSTAQSATSGVPTRSMGTMGEMNGPKSIHHHRAG